METGYPYLYVLSAVAVMAIVTYIPRMLPLTLMRRKIQNKFYSFFFVLCTLCCVGGDDLSRHFVFDF